MLDKLFTFAKKLSKPSTFQVKYRLNANGVENGLRLCPYKH